MKIEINYIESVEDILRSYSGRRLQYAIRMGILPTPEILSQLSKKVDSKNRIPKSQSIKNTKLASQVTGKSFNKVSAIELSENFSQAM